MRTWIELSEEAFRHNARLVQSRLTETTQLIFVVKANAYGHGLKEMGEMALRAGIERFAVHTTEEALELRRLSQTAQVIVIGYTALDALEVLVEAGCEITIFDREHVQALQRIAETCGKPVRVHIKLETGFMRQGVAPRELDRLIDALKQAPLVNVVGISSHLATPTDIPEDTAFPAFQNDQFEIGVKAMGNAGLLREPTLRHIAASASTFLFPHLHLDAVRVGALLYGFWPSPQMEVSLRRRGSTSVVQPVMRWKTRVAQIKDVQPGTGIGYGLTERFTRVGRIAILPVGYADGLPLQLSQRGSVLLRGHSCPIVGRVCMNITMVDVSSVPTVRQEEEVVLIGTSGAKTMELAQIGEKIGTHAYEVCARLHPLIPKRVIQSTT